MTQPNSEDVQQSASRIVSVDTRRPLPELRNQIRTRPMKSLGTGAGVYLEQRVKINPPLRALRLNDVYRSVRQCLPKIKVKPLNVYTLNATILGVNVINNSNKNTFCS